MTSPNMAKRTHGVCRGSLWRHTTSSPSNRYRVYEYCILVGTRLLTFESLQTCEKGLHPVVTLHIVGASAISTDTSSFRLMTNQGTHVHCTAPTSSCRDVWLGALNAGLERRLMEAEIPLLVPVKPPSVMRIRKTDHFCHSCGKVERLEFPLYQSCAPLPQYGLEERCDLCPKCANSQAVLDHVTFLGELYASAAQEQQAMLAARTLCLEGIHTSTTVVVEEEEESDTTTTPTIDIDTVTASLQQVSLTPQSTWALKDVLSSPAFAAHQRVSPTLDSLCQQFHQGIIGVMEFLESLDHAVGKRDPALSLLKKQAFRVAGDMGTAMKLLLEHALPPNSGAGNHRNSTDSQNTELLQCILEFLLELIDDGEMNTLAFFWSQLCCIHLRMLPPQDAAALKRVELVEDFLLTVSTRHSIQLAIELIWSHTADLEDSQGLVPTCSRECKRRRVAVIRFICELESLLFDFDSGWGGGTVCVGTVLSPSTHQVKLLANGMQDLQLFRKQAPDRLSRSVRMDKITNQKNSNSAPGTIPSSPQNRAQEALRIAQNADYFSSHLAFTKRLCDIAEKLRFMPVEQRPKALQADLAKLNVSGAMGGDPLNKVRDNHNLSRVVRVPWTEGHVFRSKERTPVLLLMEVVDEGAIASHDDDWKQTEGAKGSTTAAAAAAANAVESTPEIKVAVESPEKEDKGDSAEVEGEADSPAENGKSSGSDKAKSSKAEAEEEEKPSTEADKEKPTEESDEKPSEEADAKSSEETDEVGYASALEKSEEEMSGPATTTDDDDDEFQSAHSDDESITEGFESPTPSKKGKASAVVKKTVSIDGSINLEGSMTDSDPTSRHALRRFDSPKKGESTILTLTPSKLAIEALVTNVVAKHLQLPQLVTTREEETSSSVEKETSLADGKTEQKEYVKVQLTRNGSSTVERTKKMSTLGVPAGGDNGESSNPLSKTGDTRREVLNSIMSKGFAGSNTIAAEAATAVRRHLQDLERRRAVELLLTGEDTDEPSIPSTEPQSAESLANSSRKELLSLGIRSASADHIDIDNSATRPSEEDEAMEAVRLLLIQYRVAQGELSADAAAKALAPRKNTSLNQINSKGMKNKNKPADPREIPSIDAGDVDARLVGCGALPPAVLQALTLWKGGMVTNGELLTVVKKDLEYVRQSAELEENKDKLSEDSAFWGRFAFGERWAEKQSRIAATSPEASQPGWHLMGVIVKSNDDLRQEAFVMQLIELCQEAFQEAELELWLYPYRILSTSRSTGIIEMVRNAMSFDALKKRPGYGSGGLREHLQRMTQYTADPGEAFKSAQRNFVRSMASYSLLSYLFLFKDRHNGNILLDTAGHVIHIDFGFVFGVAPGGSFSLELSTPFKLTEEMIEVMDGLRSSLFSEFVTLFCCGFLALQAHCDTFLTIVEITCAGSTFKCFEGREPAEVVAKLRERFCPDLGKEETIAFALDLIKQATHSYGTKQYDYFQYLSQGIAA